MRIQDAARALGVSGDTLRRLDKEGKVTFLRDRNNHRRVSEEALAALHKLIYPHGPRPEGVGSASGRAPSDA
jgi:excisionase family DNA binding protein